MCLALAADPGDATVIHSIFIAFSPSCDDERRVHGTRKYFMTLAYTHCVADFSTRMFQYIGNIVLPVLHVNMGTELFYVRAYIAPNNNEERVSPSTELQ